MKISVHFKISKLLPLFLLAMFNLTACQKYFSIVPAEITGQELSGSSRIFLEQQLAERVSNIKTLKALARVEVLYRDRNSSLRYALLAERPDLLRVEGLPLNASYSLSVLTTLANMIQLVDHTNRTVKRGPLNTSSLENLLQIPAQPQELLDYLSGTFPAASITKGRLRYFYDEERQLYHLNDYRSGSYWKIAAANLELLEAQFKKKAEEEPFLQMLFEYDQGEHLPEQVTFVIPDKDLKIVLKYQFIELNQIIRPQAFEVELPDSYSLEQF